MTDPSQRRDCIHTRVHHQHGTRAAYVADRCRCVPCTVANRAAGRQRRRAMSHGSWQPYRSPAVAGRRVRRLLAAGMTVTDIATAAAVARSTISALAKDPPRRIRVNTHTAVMAVNPPRRRRRTTGTPGSTDSGQLPTDSRRPIDTPVAG